LSQFVHIFRAILVGLLLACATATAFAQQPRIAFPTAYPGTVYQNPPVGVGGGAVPFDPYGSGAGVAPALSGAPPAAAPAGTPYPYGSMPPGAFAPGGAGPAFPAPQPGSIFPNGFPTMDPNCQPWGAQPAGPYQRLFQNTGITYAFLGGDGPGNEMELNEIDIRTTAYIPRMLWSESPLLLTPGFALTLTAGPTTAGTDVPPELYGAYLDFGWFPRLTPAVGADIDVRVGVYSDFNAINTDSIRITGIAAADVVLTPNLRAKIGVNYIDRVDLKLFPYVGFIYKPHEFAQWDIIFPSPRVAYYLTTVGAHNTALWGYAGGEYGGGSWSIEHPGGTSDRMDYNDIRIYAGLEWRCVSPNGPKGFVEVGYIFERQLVYAAVPADNLDLQDTYMIRTGFSF